MKRWLQFSHRNFGSFSASWPVQNATCVRLKKRWFKGFEIWPLTFTVGPWTLTFTFHFETLTVHQLKLILTKRQWSDDYSSRIETLNSFSAFWLTLNANWKRCLKCSQSTLNSFFAPCAAQNSSSIKSRKRRFKLSQALPTNLLSLEQPKMRLA